MKTKLLITALAAVTLVRVAGCAPGSVSQINTPAPNTVVSTPTPSGQLGVKTITVNTAGPNPLVNTPDEHGDISGILRGFWHGVISPATLITSFFNKDIQVYEVHNDGSLYNLGFLLGMALVFLSVGAFVGVGTR